VYYRLYSLVELRRSHVLKIKGIFFDWGFTLAHPEPEGDILYRQCAQAYNVMLPLDGLFKAIHEADNQVPNGAPPRYREGKDEIFFLKWWDVLLGNSSGNIAKDVKMKITRLACERVRTASWVLYDDVLPAIKRLKKAGFTLGLVSNISMDRVGLERYLDITVTAKDVGVGKPDPIIFTAALQQTNLIASEAIYLGDQYNIDIVGARKAGMEAILIDRYNLNPPIQDCNCINSLSEINTYL
jgi:HAD superfamily hydrolase (TIGR01509 family)